MTEPVVIIDHFMHLLEQLPPIEIRRDDCDMVSHFRIWITVRDLFWKFFRDFMKTFVGKVSDFKIGNSVLQKHPFQAVCFRNRP